MKRIEMIELFAGCGGMALGFEQAGFRARLANDIDEDACRTLRANNLADKVVAGPIQEIGKLPKAQVIAGGPPCQGFSIMGSQRPDDPRNDLWQYYFKCVAEVAPDVFLLENVPPLLRSAQYEQLLGAAHALGYTVEATILDAADYGVPQRRKRALVIGSRVGQIGFPDATHGGSGLPAWSTIRDAFRGIPANPTIDESDGRSRREAALPEWHIGRTPTEVSEKRYRMIPEGGDRRNIAPELRPPSWEGRRGGNDAYGRLIWDAPGPTIRTDPRPSKGRYLHPVENRAITPYEAARIQGFPDTFVFCGTKTTVSRQVGNAVPPPLAAALAARIRSALQRSGKRRRAS